MFKKYYKIRKIKGITDVYFVYKFHDYFSNRRIFVPTDNFTPLNPVLTDHTCNSFVFHAKEVKKIASFDFILSVCLDEPSQLERLLPLSIDFVFKSIGEKKEQEHRKELEDNFDCSFETFQVYKRHE